MIWQRSMVIKSGEQIFGRTIRWENNKESGLNQ
jgi:hypothetical protein